MLRTDKERIVAELADQLSAAETLIVADYRGLKNKQLEALRDVLLEHGARFRIVKNTLTRQAAERAGAEGLLVMLEGPTAIAFIESSGDPAAVAKALAVTSRETNVLTLRGGIFEGQALSGEKVMELATLPPMDVLRGQLVGAIVAPVTQVVALFSAPLRDIHGLIDARIEQLGGASADAEAPRVDDTEAAAVEAEAQPVSEADADEPDTGASAAEEAPGVDDTEPSAAEVAAVPATEAEELNLSDSASAESPEEAESPEAAESPETEEEQ
jgi:large subunit ribosomal protein L10